MDARLKKFRSLIAREGLDGFLLSAPANISYLTRLRSRDAYLLVTSRNCWYLTDARYTEEARKHLKGITVEQVNGPVFPVVAGICRRLKLQCLGFEERHLNYAEYRLLRKELPDGLGLVATASLVEGLRQVKDPAELACIRKAALITHKALDFARGMIKPGLKELEICAELERFIRCAGASQASFEIIVASGPNSSYPHHQSSNRRIKANEPVLVDMGVEYEGYKSDLTRVFFSGKINPLVSKVFTIVEKAKSRALAAIKPGRKAQEIDACSRSFIEAQGFGKYFGHSLGHGVGLEIHEAPPISAKQPDMLRPGMVFTVEPAIYLPGRFGIRLEDMVVVTRKGSEVL